MGGSFLHGGGSFPRGRREVGGGLSEPIKEIKWEPAKTQTNEIRGRKVGFKPTLSMDKRGDE